MHVSYALLASQVLDAAGIRAVSHVDETEVMHWPAYDTHLWIVARGNTVMFIAKALLFHSLAISSFRELFFVSTNILRARHKRE